MILAHYLNLFKNYLVINPQASSKKEKGTRKSVGTKTEKNQMEQIENKWKNQMDYP